MKNKQAHFKERRNEDKKEIKKTENRKERKEANIG